MHAEQPHWLEVLPIPAEYFMTTGARPPLKKPARRIGTAGHEHVKENFLMTTNVKRWLLLFRILAGTKPAPIAA